MGYGRVRPNEIKMVKQLQVNASCKI